MEMAWRESPYLTAVSSHSPSDTEAPHFRPPLDMGQHTPALKNTVQISLSWVRVNSVFFLITHSLTYLIKKGCVTLKFSLT